MKKLRSVQTLRAIAALLVLFYHLSDGGFIAGGSGVDIFFLISGFIMGTVGTRETPRVFLTRRLIRIAPLYWLMTLAMCLASLIGLLANFSFDLYRLTLSFLFVPYADADGHIWPLFVPGWTLNLEMLFYAVFAVALLTPRPLAVASLLLCILVALGLHDWQAAPMIQWTTPMLLEFVLGLGVARFRHILRPGAALPLFVLSILLLAASAFVTVDPTPYRVVIWGLPACALLASCLSLEEAGRWPRRWLAPLERLGDASYSLYLTHGIVLAAIFKFLPMGILTTLVAVSLALVVAQLSYMLLERPINRFASTLRWTKLPAARP